MFERFTKAARAVVETAEAQSRLANADQIRPEHLLGALLAQQDSLAVRVLAGLGAPADRVRAELDRQAGRYLDGLDEDDAEALRVLGIDLDEVTRRIDRHLGGLTAPRGRRRFSRSAKQVLVLALREAVALRHNYIGTEHLLLGLLRVDDRVVADTLAGCGVEHAAARVAVVEALRRAG